MNQIAAASAPRTAVLARVWPWGALGLAAAFAYGRVLALDPYPSLRSAAGPTEDFFFATQGGGSPYLLLLLGALLVYHRREGIAAALGQPAAPRLVAAFGVPALCAFVWAHFVGALDLTVISFSFMLLAAGALLGGRRGVRILILPALFLLLLIPLPGVWLNAIVFPMQLATARVAASIISLLGVESVLRGDQLLTTTGLFHVIETCSGLRIIETLTMSGVLYSELFYRNRRQALILIASGPVIGLLVNQVRVVSMVLNPLSYVSSVHTAQGIIMLVGGVLLIAGLDRLLAWLDPRVESRASWVRLPSDRSFPWSDYRVRFLSLVALLVALGVVALVLPPWTPPPSTARPLYTLPAVIGDWRAGGVELPESFLGSVRFSESIHRLYESDAGEIDVFIGTDDRLDRYTSLRSGKTLLFEEGSFVEQILPASDVSDPAGQSAAPFVATRSTRAIVHGWKTRTLVQHWYVAVESLPVEVLRAGLGLDRSPLRRHEPAWVVRVATPIAADAGGLPAAEQRLDGFLPPFFAALARVSPGPREP